MTFVQSFVAHRSIALATILMAALMPGSLDSQQPTKEYIYLGSRVIAVEVPQYKIVNKNSGKVLDVQGVSQSNTALIQQWDYLGGANQQWQLVAVDSMSTYYKIVSKNSGKVLDVQGVSTANGALVQQYDYLAGANQQWQLVAVDSTYYRIVNKNSGKVLDVQGISTANGALIQQWDYLGGDNQKWQLVAVQ